MATVKVSLVEFLALEARKNPLNSCSQTLNSGFLTSGGRVPSLLCLYLCTIYLGDSFLVLGFAEADSSQQGHWL